MIVFDWRDNHRVAYDPKKFRLNKGGAPVLRDAKKVDTIVVHQTACVFGPANNDQARRERALAIPYHALAFADGSLVLAHRAREYTYHAGRLNAGSIGFAVEGVFPLTGAPQKPPRGADLAALADHVRASLTVAVEAAREDGCDIRFLRAHRQSSAMRAPDPGEWLFRIMSSHAKRSLGLEIEPSFTIGDGLPIPSSWL